MSSANPSLLTFLDKLGKPTQDINLEIDIQGIYAFPQEWKTVDEANPGLFKYTLLIANSQTSDIQFKPKEQSERQRLEAEENNAKNKKKGAKDEVAPSEEEQEKSRLLIEQQDKEQQEFNNGWDQLTEQQQFFREQEYIYKNPYCKFQNSQLQICLQGEQSEQFTEQLDDDKGITIKFIRSIAKQEQIEDLKKAKVKTFQITDLSDAVFDCFLDFSELLIPGQTSSQIRASLSQVKNADSTQFNIDKCYIKLNIVSNPSLNAKIDKIKPSISELSRKYDSPLGTSDIITQFTSELISIIEQFGIEYTNLFGKIPQQVERTELSQFKTISCTTQKIQDLNKKKEQFLYDFYSSQKYQMVKEKLKRLIVQICQDKFLKSKFAKGYNVVQRNNILSEINVYLNELIKKTLSDVINKRFNEFHEDIILSYELIKEQRKKLNNSLDKNKNANYYLECSKDYECLRMFVRAEKCLLNMIYLFENNADHYFAYSRFCVRTQQYSKAEESIVVAISLDPSNLQYQLLNISLLIIRQRYNEAVKQIKEQLQVDQLSRILNLLAAYVFKICLNDQEKGKNYYLVVQRVFMRNSGMLPSKDDDENKNKFEVVNYKKMLYDYEDALQKQPRLSNDQLDELWMELIDFFYKQSMYQLVESSLQLVKDKQTTKLQCYQGNIEISKQNYSQALCIFDKLLAQQPKNYDILLQKAYCCFLADKYYEYEETLNKAQKLRQLTSANISQFLRLGQLYLKRQAWDDALQTYQQALKFKPDCHIAYLGIGISFLRMDNYLEAEKYLAQANILDPYNPQCWGYLALLSVINNQKFDQSKSNLDQMFLNQVQSLDSVELIEILGQIYFDHQQIELSQQCYLKLLEIINQNNQLNVQNLGEIYLKIGDNYRLLNDHRQAYEYLNKAGKLVDSDLLRDRIEQLIGQLEIQSRKNS